ncbi:MAG: hypothetical protein N3A65_06690 [candidate division WOR-3 bacterium]|nr:hypothetical protein [candidate division WOR-3 bacterium]
MTRRSFLKTIGIAISSIFPLRSLTGFLWGGKLEHSKKNFWIGDKFVQKTVDLTKYPEGRIRARIEGKWQTYSLVECNSEFIEWNLKRRIEFIERIKSGKMPELGGPHSGVVATYGLNRFDSRFSLNNAVKGTGLAPKDDKLDEAIELLQSTFEKKLPEKMDVLKSIYEKPEFFDWRKQTSLELYTTREFETHTFLNIMENPVATIVFLDIPTYELRTIARIVHPDDDTALPSEKKLLRYVNLAHEYMHGKFPRTFPLLLFYIIEIFDNTPGSKRGIRVVPERPSD